MTSSSTLVATVSINYEDFTEGFLTCGTCLYAYDQAEHAPKLLSCSHTICQSCLELIASSPTLNNSAEAGCIKCPICRQNIAIPNGGVGALPPSFLVNQLFDLVNKKPREFIPKCSVHIEQELLFCETCDCVFCDTCNNNNESDDSLTSSLTTTSTAGQTSSSSSSSTSSTTTTATPAASATNAQSRQSQQPTNKQHISEVCTVIPFSTAIKRMSEILNYRSQQCSGKLDEARDNVQREIEKLESNCSRAIENIGVAFEKIKSIFEIREQQLLEEAKRLHEYKRNVLIEQLKTIENEKSTLTNNTSVKINNEMDVKNLSKKISDLTVKNDSALALFTPRENCFICFENDNESAMEDIESFMNEFGKIRTSKTYPPFCTSELIQYSTNLRSTALVQSIDYNGSRQTFGGDPLQAELKLVGYNEDIDGEISITDDRNGTYEVSFVPPVAGKYQLYIYIFNRPIKNCPLTFETNSHHNPVAIFGRSSKKGVTDQFDHFSQPASLTINKHDGRVYVLDSFNNRIKILAQIDSPECPFSFMQHIQPEFFGRSCTGIALLYPGNGDECEDHAIQALSLSPRKPANPNILVTDWRSRQIFELNSDGKLIHQFSHEDLQEPTNVAVDSKCRIFVVDRESIFIFNSTGKLLTKLTGYKYCSQKHNCHSDSLAKGKFESLGEIQKASLQQQISSLLSSAIINDDQAQNKENQANNKMLPENNGAATLNTYLINAVNDKRANAKTNTLSSLISIKRKPKLNAGSSLQRGSKAVMSAASRIRSTFTLSHSTSLVSAASLQSMFNNNKQNTMNNNGNQQVLFGSQTLNDGHQQSNNNISSNNGRKQKANKFEKLQNEAQFNNTLPISELHEDEATLINNQLDTSDTNAKGTSESVEAFGIIRAIALGPDDELIVADESRVRVLQPTGADDYVFKRELLVQSTRHPHHLYGQPQHHHHHNHQHPLAPPASNGRLSSMTYDSYNRLLLTLNQNLTTGVPYIQVIDYQTGRAKFNIDSHDSRLIRPSSLATYGQHVIVTDLGNDCIKKFRFY